MSVFSRSLIESAAWTPEGLGLAVRLNWYRAMPLSCIERFEVALDGEGLDPGRITLDVCGRTWSIADLADQDDTWWHVPEVCSVSVALDGTPRGGDSTVAVVLGTRIPYLVGPAGDAVVIVDRTSRAVAA